MRHFKLGRKVLAALVLTLLLVPAAAHAQAQSVDILKIYNEFLNLRNADEAIKYFTDDAVFQTPGGTVQGKAAILPILKNAIANADPNTSKRSIPPHVEGNKVLYRESNLVPGQNITIETDVTVEFQGDKIKKFSVAPTPESLQKLAALQGQGGTPAVPNAGGGGAAVTQEDNLLLILTLIASGVVIIVAAGVGLMMSRRTIRH